MPKSECKDCGGTGKRETGRDRPGDCKSCGGRGTQHGSGLRGQTHR